MNTSILPEDYFILEHEVLSYFHSSNKSVHEQNLNENNEPDHMYTPSEDIRSHPSSYPYESYLSLLPRDMAVAYFHQRYLSFPFEPEINDKKNIIKYANMRRNYGKKDYRQLERDMRFLTDTIKLSVDHKNSLPPRRRYYLIVLFRLASYKIRIPRHLFEDLLDAAKFPKLSKNKKIKKELLSVATVGLEYLREYLSLLPISRRREFEKICHNYDLFNKAIYNGNVNINYSCGGDGSLFVSGAISEEEFRESFYESLMKVYDFSRFEKGEIVRFLTKIVTYEKEEHNRKIIIEY